MKNKNKIFELVFWHKNLVLRNLYDIIYFYFLVTCFFPSSFHWLLISFRNELNFLFLRRWVFFYFLFFIQIKPYNCKWKTKLINSHSIVANINVSSKLQDLIFYWYSTFFFFKVTSTDLILSTSWKLNESLPSPLSIYIEKINIYSYSIWNLKNLYIKINSCNHCLLTDQLCIKN